jgi:hypothetical protein
LPQISIKGVVAVPKAKGKNDPDMLARNSVRGSKVMGQIIKKRKEEKRKKKKKKESRKPTKM